jgi:hypothetical protein
MTLVLPIAVVLASVALGTALGLAGRRADRSIGAVQIVAALAALAVVGFMLLPEAFAAAGVVALLVALAAFLLPIPIEWLGGRGGGRDIGLELGYVGLLLHQLGDGLALGVYGGPDGGGAAVLAAVGLHTVPLVAIVLIAYRARASVRAALLRAAGLALASIAGVVLVSAAPVERLAVAEPWIAAVTSGLLLHVVLHLFRSERVPPAADILPPSS